jgi:hypothetical protein
MRNIVIRDSMRRALACIAVGILSTACGDESPTSPGNQPPPAPAILTGSTGIIFRASEMFCTAKTAAWGFFGPSVISTVILTTGSGRERLGRSESVRLGDIELRLELNESTNAIDIPISGLIRGTAIDLLSSISFPNPSRVAVTDGVVTGTYSTQLGGVVGRIAGTLVYTDNQGGTMTCSEGTWLLVSGTPSIR